ncbi:chromate efflux transporter [Alloacidobacterium dinghuense]|uniref:Chromate efflux transporter n=1 Tax=Alloacidobacterium dinghuense TaxID=2763107 RepID=A0A7G8BQG1_9BACT|nr:chromate efflux transporter [Alloacidobacterium dinghuense]
MATHEKLSTAPRFSEAARFWFRLGLISFGGTAAHIAIMHDDLVERRRWIDNEDFFHALGHCMILPGPEAQQLAIYLGWRLNGIKGGIVAGALFVLPSMFVLLALSIVYARFGSLPWIAAMFSGLRPAVLALVLLALIRLARGSLIEPLQWAVAGGAFIAMCWLHISIPFVMAAAIALGFILSRYRRDSGPPSLPGREASNVNPAVRKQHLVSFAKITAAGLGIWLAPFLALSLFARDFPFWDQLGLFFTRSAFVTVGGSYTVIPYVAHAAVSKYHWLSESQMLDGFALAETTPGPLIIVVAFVGFMAGFRHFHGSIIMGIVALLLTTLYTFLPCFLFVFAGVPFIDWTQNNRSMKAVLSLVIAVVFAAMVDLALFLARGVLFPAGTCSFAKVDWIAVAAVGLSLFLLGMLKTKVGAVIVLSLAFGIARWLIRL